MLSNDDIVTSYARAFERFALAAEYMSRGCCYLDRVNTTNYANGRSPNLTTVNMANTSSSSGGGSSSMNLAGYAKYKKQNIEALALSLWKSNVLFSIRDRYQNKLFYQVFELILIQILEQKNKQ